MINVAHQMRGSIRCSPLGEHDKIKGKITFTINQKFLIYALLGFYPKMKVSKKREEAFSMPFTPRQTKGREKSFYKTLYLSEQLIREVERIASEYDTSFNNVVVSMIEYSLQNEGTNPGMEEQHERTQAAPQ